ncbi:hypothetical protein [Myroides sp. N17-2]|uniref:hypothetical protein n=1 Tax=Myroides sp. N17-2 TaxID=2030799 RepID=UPI000EFCACB9|nr:hypothetical protein [Myroides sp. N17-2]
MSIKEWNNSILNGIVFLLEEFTEYSDSNSVTLLKNNEGKSIYGFSWFISENYKNELVVRNTIYWINYPQMEKIVRQILFKNDLVGCGTIEGTSSSFVDKNKGKLLIPYDVNDGDVVNKERLNDIILRFVSILNVEAFPFFEKWSSLNTLYHYIKDMEDIEELEAVLGQFWQFKRVTIFRLCNDDRYQECMDSIYDREKKYYDEDANDIDNIRYYHAARDLKAVLDTTAPVYNV